MLSMEMDLLRGFTLEDLTRRIQAGNRYLRVYFEHRLKLSQLNNEIL
jgi:hypothetical protein